MWDPANPRCTLPISCSTDPDYCVVFVDRVGVFLEHMHRTLKAFARLPRRFSLFCLSSGSRSKHHNGCNNHRKSELITGHLRNSRHDKTAGQFSDCCFYIKDESVYEYCSRTLFVNNAYEDCAYIKNRLNRENLRSLSILSGGLLNICFYGTPRRVSVGQCPRSNVIFCRLGELLRTTLNTPHHVLVDDP